MLMYELDIELRGRMSVTLGVGPKLDIKVDVCSVLSNWESLRLLCQLFI